MAWKHDELIRAVPFRVPNSVNPELPHVGYGLAGLPGKQIPDMLFAFGGVNPEAEHLLASAPMMYQCLSQVAGAMRRMSDEIEAAIDGGHITRDKVDYVLTNYALIENDCLTFMSCATEGVDAISKGASLEAKLRKKGKPGAKPNS